MGQQAKRRTGRKQYLYAPYTIKRGVPASPSTPRPKRSRKGTRRKRTYLELPSFNSNAWEEPTLKEVPDLRLHSLASVRKRYPWMTPELFALVKDHRGRDINMVASILMRRHHQPISTHYIKFAALLVRSDIEGGDLAKFNAEYDAWALYRMKRQLRKNARKKKYKTVELFA